MKSGCESSRWMKMLCECNYGHRFLILFFVISFIKRRKLNKCNKRCMRMIRSFVFLLLFSHHMNEYDKLEYNSLNISNGTACNEHLGGKHITFSITNTFKVKRSNTISLKQFTFIWTIHCIHLFLALCQNIEINNTLSPFWKRLFL